MLHANDVVRLRCRGYWGSFGRRFDPPPTWRRSQPLPAQTAPTRQYDIILEVGAGAAMRPAYEGSKDYKYNPTGLFQL